jgi:hypothetical protein
VFAISFRLMELFPDVLTLDALGHGNRAFPPPIPSGSVLLIIAIDSAYKIR